MPFKLGRLLGCKADPRKSVRNTRSQTFRVASTRCAAALFFGSVVEDGMDFLRQGASVSVGSTPKKSLHGRFDVANNDLGERKPPSSF
jgi:hypothetical protein